MSAMGRKRTLTQTSHMLLCGPLQGSKELPKRKADQRNRFRSPLRPEIKPLEVAGRPRWYPRCGFGYTPAIRFRLQWIERKKIKQWQRPAHRDLPNEPAAYRLNSNPCPCSSLPHRRYRGEPLATDGRIVLSFAFGSDPRPSPPRKASGRSSPCCSPRNA